MQLSAAAVDVFKSEIDEAAVKCGLTLIESNGSTSSYHTENRDKYMSFAVAANGTDAIALFSVIATASIGDKPTSSIEAGPILYAVQDPALNGAAKLQIIQPGKSDAENINYASLVDLVTAVMSRA